MLSKNLTHDPPSATIRSSADVADADADQIEAIQLARLAGAVLSKSPADLMAIAETNPLIIWEWMEAFRRQKVEAEKEQRFWSAALAALSTAIPAAMRTAAE